MNDINPTSEQIMDFDDLKRVNRLWLKIYPYLALQIMAVYKKDSGRRRVVCGHRKMKWNRYLSV